MKPCLLCGGKFKNGAGLASHRRAKHPKFQGPNRLAAEETITALEREGKITDEDMARIQMLRSIADQVDADPSNAQMWKTYNEVMATLVGAQDAGDETRDEVEAIRSTAKVGHLKAV